jgi:hypothetical protein
LLVFNSLNNTADFIYLVGASPQADLKGVEGSIVRGTPIVDYR